MALNYTVQMCNWLTAGRVEDRGPVQRTTRTVHVYNGTKSPAGENARRVFAVLARDFDAMSRHILHRLRFVIRRYNARIPDSSVPTNLTI